MNIITGNGVTQVTDPATLNVLDWYRMELTRARRQRDLWHNRMLFWFGAFLWVQSTRTLDLRGWVNAVAMAALMAGCLAVQVITRRRERGKDLHGWKVIP